VIVAEQAAQTRAAPDRAVCPGWSETFRRNEPIVNTLVIPFPVVVAPNAVSVRRKWASPRTTTRFRHSSLIDRTNRSACALQLGA
jgi:hypothetical protein